jgi:adenylate cyclase
LEKADNIERRLAAILSADVHGYSRMMAEDEVATVEAIRSVRLLIGEQVSRHHGRVVDSPGDNLLAEFSSAVDAVRCAVEIQHDLAKRNLQLPTARQMEFRIGIHVGEVISKEASIYGDGVNIAARLEALARPGGVCVSGTVHDHIRDKLGIVFDDLGEQQVKNIARPVHVWRVRMEKAQAPADGPSRIRQATSVLGVVTAVVLLILGAWKFFPPEPARHPPAANRSIRSIAVLPLENLSGDPSQEYFADGMTEELITDLAQISALSVISRTSVMKFKGEHRASLPEIAKVLNVDAIVEGSVLRVGGKVRITTQLIDATADRHIWAKSYERDSRDVLALQDELASAIAREINVELTPPEQARLATSRIVNPQAHDAYLRGRYFLNSFSEEHVQKAIEEFELAVKIDPNFALAYIGLADAYNIGEDWYYPANDVMPKAKAAAQKALQLDDSIAEAHTALGIALFEYDYNLPAGEREVQRAIALNQNSAGAHNWYGFMLMIERRLDQSLAEMNRSSELDPLSNLNPAAWTLMYLSKYEAANEQSRKALDLDPQFFVPQFDLGWTDIEAGRYSDAVMELEKARKMDSPPFVAGFLGYAYAMSGDGAKANTIITELDQMSSRRFVSPFCTAIVYLGLGNRAKALDGLDKSYDARSWWLLFLKVDKLFAPLRSDPRFIALEKKVGLDK